MNYREIFYSAEDSTRLYARDYDPSLDAGAEVTQNSLPVLCLHGLTRNCRDFEPMLEALEDYSVKQGIRFIVPDQRGRGLSENAPADSYSPPVYARDMWQLMDSLQIKAFLIIGTSMGGIMSMLMSAQNPDPIKGVCLNDLGPKIDSEGLRQVLIYLNKNSLASDWHQAVATTRKYQRHNYLDFTEQDWLAFAQRTYREQPDGKLRLDYDPDISITINATVDAAVPVDLWGAFQCTRNAKVLVIRGAQSNLLSAETVAQMQATHPDCSAVEVANRGHAPLLNEPEAVEAIKAWIDRCGH